MCVCANGPSPPNTSQRSNLTRTFNTPYSTVECECKQRRSKSRSRSSIEFATSSLPPPASSIGECLTVILISYQPTRLTSRRIKVKTMFRGRATRIAGRCFQQKRNAGGPREPRNPNAPGINVSLSSNQIAVR